MSYCPTYYQPVLVGDVGAPVSPPSNAAFTARYPAFAAVDGALITAVLAEAANEVDSRWTVADQNPAVMAFAAHLLSSEGYGGGTVDVGGVSTTTSGPLSSYRAGDTEIKFSTAGQVRQTQAGSTESTDLSSTPYGLRFLELQRRNIVSAVLVV